MGTRQHRYEVSVSWTGNRGSGTSAYRDEAATRLHSDAGATCFIARSVNFPVRPEPVIVAR